LHGDAVCLMGNVNCGLIQTGTDEEVIESVRYALESGMPGGGYIFYPYRLLLPSLNHRGLDHLAGFNGLIAMGGECF
jgi:hypothetical protein